MKKLTPFKNSTEQTVGYYFLCPGCRQSHAVFVSPHKSPNGASWDFNGDLENPTFSPSLVQRISCKAEGIHDVCHLFVRNGWLEFLADCTHKLAGQKAEMLDASITLFSEYEPNYG